MCAQPKSPQNSKRWPQEVIYDSQLFAPLFLVCTDCSLTWCSETLSSMKIIFCGSKPRSFPGTALTLHAVVGSRKYKRAFLKRGRNFSRQNTSDHCATTYLCAPQCFAMIRELCRKRESSSCSPAYACVAFVHPALFTLSSCSALLLYRSNYIHAQLTLRRP